MKPMVLILFLLFSFLSPGILHGEGLYHELIPVNKNTLVSLAKKIIAEKKPDIDLDDLAIYEITYKDIDFNDATHYEARERLMVRFIMQSSKTKKGIRINYKTVDVKVGPFGDIAKSSIAFGQYQYESESIPLTTSLLKIYNKGMLFLGEIVWIILMITLYARFKEKFALLFLASSALGLLYYLLPYYIVKDPSSIGTIRTMTNIAYGLGVTLAVIASYWALTVLKSIKSDTKSDN